MTATNNTFYLYNEPTTAPREAKYGCNYYVSYSRKLGRQVRIFGMLNHANQVMLEADAEVEYYCENPLETTVLYDGMRKKVAYEFYVHYIDGRDEMQGVMYQKDAESSEKCKLQELWCKQNMIDYALRTELDIFRGDRTLENLEWIIHKAFCFKNTERDDLSERAIIEYIKRCECVTIGMLYASGRLSESNGMECLADLFLRGKIDFDNIDNAVIKNSTEVHLCQH